MSKMKSVATISNKLKKTLKGYNNGQNINKYEKYIYLILFYRYLSENMCEYIQEKHNIKYISLSNEKAETYRVQTQEDKDFFIYPEDLFHNIVAKELNNSRLDSILNSVFHNIKQSSKHDICDIFRNIDTEGESIGISQKLRSDIFANILIAISKIDYDIKNSPYDLFGNIFEFLLNTSDTNNNMSLKNGIFYTQPTVVRLLKKIADQYIKEPRNIYDPTCGSGSLLTEYSKYNNTIPYYGKELNEIPAILCKMNLILHNVKDFTITQCDTLSIYDKDEKGKYDLILSNPPFGIPLSCSLNDERFKDKPVPTNLADWAFIYHILHTLNDDGLALTIDTPKMLSRNNKDENLVRKYLVDSNQIDAIILLPKKMFLRTDTGTCLFIFRKNKIDNNVLFIDATSICNKIGGQAKFSDEHIENIIELLLGRKSLDNLSYLATSEDIEKHDYSLNISDYIKYKVEKTFTNIDSATITDFIFDNEEEANYKLRLKYNEDIRNAKKCISNIFNTLKQNNQIKMVSLDRITDIVQGSKLKDLKIETNDSFPYRFISTKEIQDGVIIQDNPIVYKNMEQNISPTRIRKEDLEEYLRKGKLKKDDVLFTCYSKGTKAAIVDEPNFIFADEIYRLRPIKNIENEVISIYLKYILESDYFINKINNCIKRYYQTSNSSTFYLPVGELKQITIPVVPLKIQGTICTLLALIDIEYTKLKLSLKREQEVYQYRYQESIKNMFNDITNK